MRKKSVIRSRALLMFVIVCFLVAGVGFPVYALESNDDEIQIPALADTYVNPGSSANLNFGSSPTLQVRTWSDPNYTRESYMKFDLSSYPGQLGTATLNVYAAVNNANGSPLAFQLYGVEEDSWTENMMIWNDKPAMNHYLANVDVGLTWQWIQVDVTSFVKAQLASDQMASFGLTQAAKNGALIHINSKESPANQPYLSLSHERVNPSAPKWPSGASVEIMQLNENGLDLKWTEPKGSANVSNYRIIQNDKTIATVTGTTYHIPIPSSDIGKTYTLKIEAGSNQNRWSHDGPYITVTIPKTELKQVNIGNVFIENEPIQLKVATLQPSVTWSVYDMQGTQMSGGTEYNDKGQMLIHVPYTKRGYFKLKATVESSNVQPPVPLETSFAVLSPYDFTAVADSPFGMGAHLHRGQTTTIPLIQQAGAKSVRTGIEWHAIEKTKGEYTFSPVPDNYMAKLKEQGIGKLFVAAYNNPFYDNNGTPYTDQGREGFANYAEAYVDNYKDQLIAMEAYNEFHGSFGKRGNSPANSRPDYYFKLLKKTYETVKAEHPEFPVYGIVASEDAVSWIEEVFKLGGLQYMDAVTLHPYLYPNEPEGLSDSLERIKALIRQYNNGQDKPIWLTEFGYPTHKAGNGVDEITQANYLVRYHVLALSIGVEKLFWYNMVNDGLRNDYNEDNFGILRNAADPLGAFTPKPAYAAYAAMTRELTGWQFSAEEPLQSGLKSYMFANGGQNKRVVWSLAPASAVIRTNQPVEITDMMGNTRTFAPTNGNIYVTLTGEPIYIKGNIQSINKDATFTVSGGSARSGEPVMLQVEMNNMTAEALDFTLEIEEQQFVMNAAPGQNKLQTVVVNGLDEPGTRIVKGVVKLGGQAVGLLQHVTAVLPSETIHIRPVINGTDPLSQSIKVQIRNHSMINALPVHSVDWKLGTLTGRQELNQVLQPDSAREFNIPLQSMELSKSYPANVDVAFGNNKTYTYSGSIEFNPVYYGTVNVDGNADPLIVAKPATIDLSKGNVKVSGYNGANDLSGSVWLNYDNDHVYFTAKIKDNIHAFPATDVNIWNNDSIQFAISSGLPGEDPKYYEYGISQTSAGPQIYRWIAPAGVSKGLVTGGTVRVARDEAQKLTTYELALPWSELTPIGTETGVFSLSLLVNENDGNLRRGYIEWGGGIGDGKAPSKFRTMQWVR
ncbi:hypothetical protein DVH26_10755 [Paenibacillus sp. H1-7]|uniref:CBM96 family carbohydrate-binding protein n=1 Tax=Paenibacillus sp. H1-7 TaxID=2282849 RepID=UPI001EF7849D|nr:DNRLRE domain-containing protein [Paenibacillus sp. H1-7]ULL14880.1 hypothetical protein DVH26_10755 [Paenibacillus sp. H1-7]